MKKALQPVSINGIEFDALMNSTEAYESQVPEYSVETGFSVTDTIILNPETLDLTLLISNYPITWKSRFGVSSDRVQQVVKQLKEMYFQKQLVTVTTATDTYTTMAITSISFSKDNGVYGCMEVPIKLKKVRVTEAKTTTIPDSYGKSGTTAASAGTASTSSGSSRSSSGSGGSSGGGSSGSSSTSSSSGGGSSGGSSGGGGSSGSILYNAAKGIGLL